MNATRFEGGATGPLIIRPMLNQDGPEVLTIYGEGIATGDATFEITVPTWQVWDAAHSIAHRLVACPSGAPCDIPVPVLGWAACTPVSGRCVYAGVLEVSVYVSRRARGQGIGSSLLAALITDTDAAGVWTLQAGIFTENAASLALHLAAGFRVVGTRERLGQRANRWRDVVLLERRSAVVG
jgi:L-amino acid N-acyltransferase YncA